MLIELRVAGLGVIDELALLFGPGMTALTGETGAGKTMVVEAIDLLMGGRADSALVRPGATEAVVEGRFNRDGDEVILRRVVPRDGRSRAYVDGGLATAGVLAELGAALVDLHGQHAHQSLLATAVQRRALDTFGQIDTGPVTAAEADLAAIDAALADLGGDDRARARELDLVRFQVDELDAAGLDDPAEDEALEAAEDELADALGHREAGFEAVSALETDAGAGELLGQAVAALGDRRPFEAAAARLRSVVAELDDLRADLRAAVEAIDDDPERLAEVRQRRQTLLELRRKYGDDLAAVIAFRDEARARLIELGEHDERAADLDRRREAAVASLAAARAGLLEERRAIAPELAAEVEARLHDLAMADARFGVDVAGEAGETVSFQFSANPGAPLLPLAKVASGGELARAMLAFRMVLTQAPPVLVFDEVDAGIGGETAHAVGRCLAELGQRHQVLVVTHLAQVAACADHQVAVVKSSTDDETVSRAQVLADDERVVELSRMLSGSPDSGAAREHALELLAGARGGRA